jgi:hypothetical protein
VNQFGRAFADDLGCGVDLGSHRLPLSWPRIAVSPRAGIESPAGRRDWPGSVQTHSVYRYRETVRRESGALQPFAD